MPFWIPLAMAAGSAIAGGIGAKKRADEAKRIARQNAELSALDTRMSPWVKSNAYKQDVPDAGPGAFAGALSGGISGFSAGQNIQGAMAKEDLYKQLLDKEKQDLLNYAPSVRPGR